ncbi:MAG TPA: GTPase Era [Myxococcota bacterium]|jgi:GTP-binding protein Era
MAPEPEHRAGVVALLGRPNVGKSTLMNELVGEKLAIVTPKPQTTRSRLLGIATLPNAQLVLIDTPGWQAGTQPLHDALNRLAEQAARGCDVAAVLTDLRSGWGEVEAALAAGARSGGAPVIAVGTQRDRAPAAPPAWPPPAEAGFAAVLTLSARTGEGLAEFTAACAERLPVSPALYTADELSDRPLRFLAAELVREAAFGELAQELPYALAVEVVEFDEKRADLVRVRADLLVERISQKKIVVGAGGAMIKRIGIRARREIEMLLGTKVHLDLFVKHEPGWAKRPNRLKSLGYY